MTALLLQSIYQGVPHMTASCCDGLVCRQGPTGYVTIVKPVSKQQFQLCAQAQEPLGQYQQQQLSHMVAAILLPRNTSYNCFMLQWSGSQERSHRICNYHQTYFDATVSAVCSGAGAIKLAPATTVISSQHAIITKLSAVYWSIHPFYRLCSELTRMKTRKQAGKRYCTGCCISYFDILLKIHD